jgi:hypothetical protein
MAWKSLLGQANPSKYLSGVPIGSSNKEKDHDGFASSLDIRGAYRLGSARGAAAERRR